MPSLIVFSLSGLPLSLLASLGLVAASPTARAQPTLAQRTAFYAISGASPADLRAEMNARGPVDVIEAQRYDAHTNTFIRWQVTTAPVTGGCQLATVTTHVDVTFTMPQWLDNARASPVVRAKWDAYRSSLMAHERGHAAIARHIASRIETAIRAIGPKASCPEVGNAANSIGYGILSTDRSHQEYDRATRHGTSRGAVWQ